MRERVREVVSDTVTDKERGRNWHMNRERETKKRREVEIESEKYGRTIAKYSVFVLEVLMCRTKTLCKFNWKLKQCWRVRKLYVRVKEREGLTVGSVCM